MVAMSCDRGCGGSLPACSVVFLACMDERVRHGDISGQGQPRGSEAQGSQQGGRSRAEKREEIKGSKEGVQPAACLDLGLQQVQEQAIEQRRRRPECQPLDARGRWDGCLRHAAACSRNAWPPVLVSSEPRRAAVCWALRQRTSPS